MLQSKENRRDAIYFNSFLPVVGADEVTRAALTVHVFVEDRKNINNNNNNNIVDTK